MIATVVAFLAVAVVFVAPVIWLAVDEAAVPPRSDVPALPTGVRVVDEQVQCGSGGCWRELTLAGPANESPTEIAASLGLRRETCSPRSLVDRREVCRGVNVTGGNVRLYVKFHRPL
ncbi:hypothetical protein SAMN05421678_10554 [Actinopolymorpha cephalotaxi]|uniref:Uncharacterized protein n=1 Tax=Actinopolymorpha cephalotaxi TaxID=504797 RepID=A0A1I2QPX6_9ACTN|nr:hypothetical protein [Actinopolymorpha cephalotaxi]NYH82539.1 hypothetical protein [Actinopolymorpha cephalotaxi]SFG30655.1 hypothetical protein SAMN05421678_10554 [Actinopolymorpha cephalotaxi]